MWLKCLVVMLAVWSVWSQRSCSRDRMRQCNEELRRSIQKRINDMNRQDMSTHCINVRDDFNCLLRETRCLTSETERNTNGDTLRNALQYIRDGCDTLGGSWRDSSCFIGENMKSCESSYPLGGSQYSSHNPETCRKFNLFNDCVMETIQNRCRRDDERLLGQYLVDSAQDLAWNCGESTSDRDRIRDDSGRQDRYNNDRYGSDRDRDRSRDNNGRGDYRDYGRGDSRDSGRGDYRDNGRGDYRDRYSQSDRNSPSGGSSYNSNGSSDITCCRNERCDSNRMRRCRDSLSRAIDDRSSGYQDSQKCRRTRDDFNCLLWQTSSCVQREERDQVNDIFRRARDFISRNCDTFGRWRENNCYKSSNMQRCENSLSSTRSGANYESCRSYNSFRECMLDELQRGCAREDDLFQGAYLVDKAQELSWQCGNDQYNGRNQYTSNNRRDPYDNPSYSGYEDTPRHLDDDDAMCLSRVQPYADTCKSTLQEKRNQLHIEDDYDERHRITCCSARQYRDCLYDATKRICQRERRNVVDSLLGPQLSELNTDNCRRLYVNDCNAGYALYGSLLLTTLCLGVLSALFTIHF